MKWGYWALLALVAPRVWAFPCLEPALEKKTDIRPLKAFETLVVRGSLDVEVRRGGEPRVEISGPTNFLAVVQTKLKGTQLVIDNEGCLKDEDELRLVVYGSGLKSLVIEGSSDVQLFDALLADRSHIKLLGSGDVTGEVKTTVLEVALNGSGDIKLKGNADKLQASINGSGDVEAKELDSKDVDIKISGSGDASLKASDSLKVQINGSGDVSYSGDPKVKDIKVSGSGSVGKS